MTSRFIALSLLAATAALVTFWPAAQPGARTSANPPASTAVQQPRIDVVFVLDTTSSMSGFIQAAKEKIWSIATTMASAQPTPEIRIGLVAFRDRGDAYVTQVTDLSANLDSVYATLMDYRAEGGGDGPESVNQALHDAIHRINWSDSADTYKVVFLVGDAPPHMDYANDVPYEDTLAAAAKAGILVNTILSGTNAETAQRWRHIAGLGQGDFLTVASDGNAVAVKSPFDDELATLAAALDDTRLYFGDETERAAQAQKLEATAKVHREASIASRARRAAFNVSPSGATNFLGEHELVEAVSAGRVDIRKLDPALLPAPLRELPVEERAATVAANAAKRDALRERISTLSAQRDEYIAAEVASGADADGTLDHQLHDTLKRQARHKGLSYEAGPRY